MWKDECDKIWQKAAEVIDTENSETKQYFKTASIIKIRDIDEYFGEVVYHCYNRRAWEVNGWCYVSQEQGRNAPWGICSQPGCKYFGAYRDFVSLPVIQQLV